MTWNWNGTQPLYIQIADIIKQRIVCGRYPPGYKLPSVRDLASETAVNPNTVQKAFSDLEKLSLINTERTSGRFVTSDELVISDAKILMAREFVLAFAHNMQTIGYGKNELCEQIRLALEDDTPPNEQ